MAQVTFVSAGAGAALNGAGTLSVPYPAGIQVNDILVLFVTCRSNDGLNTGISIPNFTGVVNLSGSFPGFSYLSSYYVKVSAGNETGNLVVTITGDTASKLKFGRMYAFRNAKISGINSGYVPSNYWQFTSTPPPQPLNDQIANTSNIVNFGDVWSPENDALGFCIVNVWDDNPQTAPTNAIGGTYTEPVAEFTSTIGTDGSIGIFTVPLSANQLVTGGSFSMGGGANSDPYTVSMFTILAASPGVSFTPVDPMGQMGFFGL